VLQIRTREFSLHRAAQKKGLLSTYLLTHFIGFIVEMHQKTGVNGRGFHIFLLGIYGEIGDWALEYARKFNEVHSCRAKF